MSYLLYLNTTMRRFLFQNALTVILPIRLTQSAGKWRVLCIISGLFVCFWRDSPQWVMASSLTRFLDHTQRRITVEKTPLDEWSASRKDLYLITHTTLRIGKRPCPWWDSNPQSHRRAAADLYLRPWGHWDRQYIRQSVQIPRALKGYYVTVYLRKAYGRVGA